MEILILLGALMMSLFCFIAYVVVGLVIVGRPVARHQLEDSYSSTPDSTERILATALGMIFSLGWPLVLVGKLLHVTLLGGTIKTTRQVEKEQAERIKALEALAKKYDLPLPEVDNDRSVS